MHSGLIFIIILLVRISEATRPDPAMWLSTPPDPLDDEDSKLHTYAMETRLANVLK